MQIEDNQNDDFHRTDLEGGDEPADDEMMAAPEEDAMMEPPKDDDYMGEEMMSANSNLGYDDGMSEATREAKSKLEEWSLYVSNRTNGKRWKMIERVRTERTIRIRMERTIQVFSPAKPGFPPQCNCQLNHRRYILTEALTYN